jgi:hypothetical protein
MRIRRGDEPLVGIRLCDRQPRPRRQVTEAQAIVTAERLRRTRQIGLDDFVNRLRAG